LPSSSQLKRAAVGKQIAMQLLFHDGIHTGEDGANLKHQLTVATHTGQSLSEAGRHKEADDALAVADRVAQRLLCEDGLPLRAMLAPTLIAYLSAASQHALRMQHADIAMKHFQKAMALGAEEKTMVSQPGTYAIFCCFVLFGFLLSHHRLGGRPDERRRRDGRHPWHPMPPNR
jgi:hypothetical protein